MPRKRRKTANCLNCNYHFIQDENYCPVCGQENNHKIQPVRYILKDFIDDLIQIDTRLVRSLVPFLFFPGKLTNEYIKGKRVYYVTPIRLYLIVSFFYFFIFSLLILNSGDLQVNKSNKELIIGASNESPEEIRKSDSAKLVTYEKKLKKRLLEEEDSSDVIEKITKIKARAGLTDDSLKAEVKRSNENSFKVNGTPLNSILELAKNDSITEDMLMDSLKIEKTFSNRLAVRQSIRIANSTPREVISSVLEKVPVMMFFLLPVFAFLLKVLYFRSKRFYVEHLIFTLHIHSFFFFIFTIAIALAYALPESAEDGIGVSVIIAIVYGFLSFNNVYRQNIFKALVKTVFLFVSYSIIISFALIFEILVSLLLF